MMDELQPTCTAELIAGVLGTAFGAALILGLTDAVIASVKLVGW